MSVRRAVFEALRKLTCMLQFALAGMLPAGLMCGIGACTEPLFYSKDAGLGDLGNTFDAGWDSASTQPGEGGSEPPTCERPNCSAPEAPDASTAAETGPEREAGADAESASGPVDAGLDPIRSMWAGRFATRSFLFSYDSPLKTTARLLTLAQIKPTADGGLSLEEELCLFEGSWSLLVTGQLRVDFPKTKFSAALIYDHEHFESAVGVAKVGYGEAPEGCNSGATTTSPSSAQAWLTNSCDCPRDPSTPPATMRDCRVSDPDGDGKPGMTFNVLVETSKLSFHVTQEERVRLVKGYRVGERLYAQREFHDTTRTLDCVIDDVPTKGEDCPLGSAKACPTQYNNAELFKLEDSSYDCARIVEREQSLFGQPRPEYPAACPAAVSGTP